MWLFWCNYIAQLIFDHYALLRNDYLFQTLKSSITKLKISRTAGWIPKLFGDLLIWIPPPTIPTFSGIFSSSFNQFRISMDCWPISRQAREVLKLHRFQLEWNLGFGHSLCLPLFPCNHNRLATAFVLDSGKLLQSLTFWISANNRTIKSLAEPNKSNHLNQNKPSIATSSAAVALLGFVWDQRDPNSNVHPFFAPPSSLLPMEPNLAQ